MSTETNDTPKAITSEERFDYQDKARQQLMGEVVAELRKRGYVLRVQKANKYKLNVHTAVTAGFTYLGELSFTGVYYHPWAASSAQVSGEVDFNPSVGHWRRSRGTYKLNAQRQINTSSLLARLKQITPEAIMAAEGRKASAAREAADKALAASLGIDNDARGSRTTGLFGVVASAWDGKVKLDIDALEPDVARQLLAILRANVPVLPPAADEEE